MIDWLIDKVAQTEPNEFVEIIISDAAGSCGGDRFGGSNIMVGKREVRRGFCSSDLGGSIMFDCGNNQSDTNKSGGQECGGCVGSGLPGWYGPEIVTDFVGRVTGLQNGNGVGSESGICLVDSVVLHVAAGLGDSNRLEAN